LNIPLLFSKHPPVYSFNSPRFLHTLCYRFGTVFLMINKINFYNTKIAGRRVVLVFYF